MFRLRAPLVAYGAVLALLVAVPAHAKGAPPKLGHIEGAISAVDAVAVPHTVTITTSDATPVSQTLNVTDATVVNVQAGDEDERGDFSDLRVGLAAEASYNKTSLDAVKIHVAEDPNEVATEGNVVSLDVALGLLSIDTDGVDGADTTFTLDAQTSYSLNGVDLSAEQAGLLLGLHVAVSHAVDQTLAFSVAGDAETLEASGKVTAVDLAAHSLELDTNGDGTADLTFTTADGMAVKILGKKLQFGGLLVGDRVAVQYVDAQGTNVALRASLKPSKPRNVQGTVTAVGADSLTIHTRKGSDVTLTVSNLTSVRLKGKKVSLADVQALLTAGKTVKVQAQYIVRGGLNLALQVRLNVTKGKGGGHGH
jgi:hypothetical protein